MSDATRNERKALADQIRELALLVETGCADAMLSLTTTASRRHYKLEIVEPRREWFDAPTLAAGDPADTAA